MMAQIQKILKPYIGAANVLNEHFTRPISMERFFETLEFFDSASPFISRKVKKLKREAYPLPLFDDGMLIGNELVSVAQDLSEANPSSTWSMAGSLNSAANSVMVHPRR